jgi:hypothetical protein
MRNSKRKASLKIEDYKWDLMFPKKPVRIRSILQFEFFIYLDF